MKWGLCQFLYLHNISKSVRISNLRLHPSSAFLSMPSPAAAIELYRLFGSISLSLFRYNRPLQRARRSSFTPFSHTSCSFFLSDAHEEVLILSLYAERKPHPIAKSILFDLISYIEYILVLSDLTPFIYITMLQPLICDRIITFTICKRSPICKRSLPKICDNSKRKCLNFVISHISVLSILIP